MYISTKGKLFPTYLLSIISGCTTREVKWKGKLKSKTMFEPSPQRHYPNTLVRPTKKIGHALGIKHCNNLDLGHFATSTFRHHNVLWSTFSFIRRKISLPFKECTKCQPITDSNRSNVSAYIYNYVCKNTNFSTWMSSTLVVELKTPHACMHHLIDHGPYQRRDLCHITKYIMEWLLAWIELDAMRNIILVFC
jgi:hypothetical protein